MAETQDPWLAVDALVEDQLALQVKISFAEHSAYLNSTGLHDCRLVADLGCGNGAFLKRLAEQNPKIAFIGVDKRDHLLARASEHSPSNTKWIAADLLDGDLPPAAHAADGFLMRYFLLHIPNAKSSLERWLKSAKSGSHFWIIDVDLATFKCDPPSADFEILKDVTQKFCEANSVDTMAGQKIGALLNELGFQEVSSHPAPFSSGKIEPAAFTRFLRNEAYLYCNLMDIAADSETLTRINRFLDHDVSSGKYAIDYGMILWHGVCP